MGIKIQYDYKGLEKALLNGSGIEKAEREVMEQKLSEIQGQFIIDFGVEGNFVVEERVTAPTKYGTSRSAFKISANDARTKAILKRHPGWLAKFIQ